MDIKKFLTGKRPKKSTETIALLRKRSNKIQIRARALKRMSQEERDNAKLFLKEGNKAAAQQALMRRKNYQRQLTEQYKKAALLQNVITGITNAQDNAELVNELSQAQGVIESVNRQSNPEKVDEVLTNLEANIEEVNYASERLTESSLVESEYDFDYDAEEINDELSALMSEIEEEAGITTEPRVKQPTPTRTTTTPAREKIPAIEIEEDLPEPVSGGTESSDPREKEIRDEIARIKKEMESELR